MSRLVKYFWFLSMFIFFVTLLYVYAYLPGMVGIHAGPQGNADQFIDRSTFFYVCVGLFIITNMSLYVLKRLLQAIWLRNSATASTTPARMSMREDVANWLLGFAAAINIFFVLILVYLAIFNNSEDMNQGMYSPLVYGGPVLIVIFFLVLIYIFAKKRSA